MIDWFITHNRQILAAVFIAATIWTAVTIWKNGK